MDMKSKAEMSFGDDENGDLTIVTSAPKDSSDLPFSNKKSDATIQGGESDFFIARGNTWQPLGETEKFQAPVETAPFAKRSPSGADDDNTVAETRKFAAMILDKDSVKNNHHAAMSVQNEVSEKHAPSPISLKFIDLKYKIALEKGPWKIKKPCGGMRILGKEILHGITGSVLPGEVLALMGPSGSGKTTLLKALSGRLSHNVHGTITYNDMSYTKALKRRIGFVMQDDILYPHLTVRETLTYAALLRMRKTLSRKQKIERAQELIYELGLERCQDTLIGEPFLRGISGGERKRVSIGHEILIDPSILFLDEPTSGLDSTTALRIVQMLTEISKIGRTVVTTIHQPSSRLFHMFDKLILLAEGHLMYSGKAADAMDYFSSVGFSPLIAMNPADFFLDLANGITLDVAIPTVLKKTSLGLQNGDVATPQPPGKVVQKYLLDSCKTTLAPVEKRRLQELESVKHAFKEGISARRQWNASWWQQFSVLFVRGLRERRHEYFSWLRVLQVLAYSLIVACLWWQSKLHTQKEVEDQAGLLFFISIFWGFFPLFTAIFTFPQERTILAKERASDMYRLSAFFMARTLGDLPLDLVLPIIFLLIVYFTTHLHISVAAFFFTLLSIFLNVATAQGLGMAIGAAMMDVKKATTFASVIVVAFMLSGGFFIQHIPPSFAWIQYMSFNYYAYKLLIKVQYNSNQVYDCTHFGCKSLGSSTAFHGISLGGGGEEVLAMLIMAVAYRVIAYITLHYMRLGV